MTVAADINVKKEKDLLEYIVRHIVEEPDSVIINVKEENQSIVINLKVSKVDMGKIIGKNGQTARAIRILLRILGAKTSRHISLKIIEPEEGEE